MIQFERNNSLKYRHMVCNGATAKLACKAGGEVKIRKRRRRESERRSHERAPLDFAAYEILLRAPTRVYLNFLDTYTIRATIAWVLSCCNLEVIDTINWQLTKLLLAMTHIEFKWNLWCIKHSNMFILATITNQLWYHIRNLGFLNCPEMSENRKQYKDAKNVKILKETLRKKRKSHENWKLIGKHQFRVKLPVKTWLIKKLTYQNVAR